METSFNEDALAIAVFKERAGIWCTVSRLNRERIEQRTPTWEGWGGACDNYGLPQHVHNGCKSQSMW